MSCVTCHYLPCTALTVEQRRVLDVIIALRQHNRSDDIELVMTSSPFDGLHYRNMWGVACYNLPWEAHTVGQCRVWQHIFTVESIHDQWTSGVAYYHSPISEHMIGPRRALHDHMALA